MRHWKIIGAVVVLLGEGALQLSGYTSLPLAIGLGVVGVGLLIWSAWPLILKIRFRTPITTKADITILDRTNHIKGGQYTSQEIHRLDSLIQLGEILTGQMQTSDFDASELGRDVHHWLDSVEEAVWEMLPRYASYIVAEQGDVTSDEKLRYIGWGWDVASLRISVDRRLARLREIRSQIQAPDKEGSHTELV